MAYADREKIASRSTKYITEGTVPDERLVFGQQFADAEIDSRLPFKGAPFDDPGPTPAKIVEIAADLAAYFVILDLFQNGTADAPVEYAQHLKERADQALDRLAGGTSVLPDPEGVDPVDTVPSSVYFTQRTAGVLENFDGVTPPRCYPRGGRRWLSY